MVFLKPAAAVSAIKLVVPIPSPFELVIGDRCRARVPAGFDPATLHQLLDVLERRP
jgi:hypothetical protein